MSHFQVRRGYEFLWSRWERASPEEGTPQCKCSLCGASIGEPGECRDEDCIGCSDCEIAIRIFKPRSASYPQGGELRFHTACFEKAFWLPARIGA